MRKRRKSFVLDSDVIENCSWSINCSINDDGSFDSLGSINIRDNKARIKKYKSYRKDYKQNHKERTNECQRKRYAESPEEYREYHRNYDSYHPEQVKERSKKYFASHKKLLRKKQKKYRDLHPEQFGMYRAKRRGYGHREINNWDIGTVGHHINDEEIVYIPEKVHRMFQTGEKENHRELIKEWLRDIRPDLYLRCYA